jgi:hypothetical protein
MTDKIGTDSPHRPLGAAATRQDSLGSFVPIAAPDGSSRFDSGRGRAPGSGFHPEGGRRIQARADRRHSSANPPWLFLLLDSQFELNCLSSVAIEFPSLQPRVDALRMALDGPEAAV